jgi:hypothetical protein
VAKRKLTKREVAYRPASLTNLDRRCGQCSMYVQGGRCTAVTGLIVAAGVCAIWAPKRAR